MKLSPDKPSIAEDQEFREVLSDFFRKQRAYINQNKEGDPPYKMEAGKGCSQIIDCGGYHGLGTTKVVIDILTEMYRFPEDYGLRLIVFEADHKNYLQCRKNTSGHKWVRRIHGSTVDIERALRFLDMDEMLRNPERYPDIYYDCEDPVPFYKKEVQGALFGGEKPPRNDALKHQFKVLNIGNPYTFVRIDRLACPLFLMDSCGGTGWLEYQTIMELMGEHKYYIWFRNIDHVKHYRTYLDVTKPGNDMWKIIHEKKGEWVFAKTKYVNKIKKKKKRRRLMPVE